MNTRWFSGTHATIMVCVLAAFGAASGTMVSCNQISERNMQQKTALVNTMLQEGRSAKDVALIVAAIDGTQADTADNAAQKRADLTLNLLRQNSKMSGEDIERIVKAAYPPMAGELQPTAPTTQPVATHAPPKN